MVEVEGITCFEKCKNHECGKAPFVKINDEIIQEASLIKVLEKIEEITYNPAGKDFGTISPLPKRPFCIL